MSRWKRRVGAVWVLLKTWDESPDTTVLGVYETEEAAQIAGFAEQTRCDNSTSMSDSLSGLEIKQSMLYGAIERER